MMDRIEFSGINELEFAYWLENATKEDDAVLRALMDRYTSEIIWLTNGLIELIYPRQDRDLDIVELTARIFKVAWRRIDQFRGHDNVRTWLIRIMVNEIHKAQPGMWRFRKPKLVDSYLVDIRFGSQDDSGDQLSQVNLGMLSMNERIAFYLRYNAGLDAVEIAYVMGISPEGACKLLSDSRVNIGFVQPKTVYLEDDKEIHARTRFHANLILDGYKGLDNEQKSEMKSHLISCSFCKEAINWRERLDEALMQASQIQWSRPDLRAIQIEQIHQIAKNKSKRGRPWLVFNRYFSEVILISVVLAAMGLIGLYFSSQDVDQGAVLIRPNSEVTPTAVEASAAIEHSFPGLETSDQMSNEFIHYSGLDLSSDAGSLVFTQERRSFLMGRYSTESNVYFLDLTDGTKELISTGASNISANGHSYSPSISGDGNRVVFVSTADDLIHGKVSKCPLGRTNLCAQIFLRDISKGTLSRISSSPDGSPANSNSALPVISADGRWVAYWSAATNIVPGEESYCRQDSPTHYCWDIYLHDLQSGRTDRLSIGRTDQPYDLQFTDALNLSGNGQLLSLTLHRSDQLAADMGVDQAYEAYLYDLQRDIFIPLNVNNQGAPGNGSSAKPVISQDGRFAAFASQASNLVENDSNRSSDVFLYDVETQKVERISLSSTGEQGKGDSGTRFRFELSWLERIDISADGRFIVFLSTAENLLHSQGRLCSSESWYPCFNIYIYDRLSHQIEQPITKPNYTYFFHSPEISADGRWVTFVRFDQFCNEVPLCTTLILHDRSKAENIFLLGRKEFTEQEGENEYSSSTLVSEASSSVNCLQFSPSGDVIATGSNDGAVNLWSISDEELISTFKGHTLPVSSVSFSPDGTRLASGSHDGKVIIWRLLDGAQLAELRSYTGAVLSLAFSPDGESLAVGAIGAAWIWELGSGDFNLVGYFSYPLEQVHDISYTEDGRLMAHAASDGSVWIRRSTDGTLMTRLSGHEDEVLAVEFSPAGDRLASGSKDGSVNVWQVESGSTNMPTFTRSLILRHADWVNGLAFSPQGQLLAVAAFHSNLPVWRIPEGEPLSDSLGTRWFQSKAVQFSPEGDILAVGSAWGSVQLWYEIKP